MGRYPSHSDKSQIIKEQESLTQQDLLAPSHGQKV